MASAFSTVSVVIVGGLMSAPVRERHQDQLKSVAPGQTSVIQNPELGVRIMRYELADYEWIAIKPMLPNKPRGVPRVNDQGRSFLWTGVLGALLSVAATWLERHGVSWLRGL